MEQHGVEFVGPTIVESMIELPEWTINDIGRIIYVSEVDLFFMGRANRWAAIKEDITEA